MQTKTLLFLSAFSLLVLNSCKQSNPPEKYKTLVWSDEFNGTELNLNNWEIQLGTGTSVGLTDWGNNEEQFYRAENISLENGNLRIRSQRESFGGKDYTSARIRSKNLADFKYGRFEARIRMDNTPGLWHAFWMLPSGENASWPVDGEIDIMEYIGILNYKVKIYLLYQIVDLLMNLNI
jgi:beta-glucanase (GH16 family)